MDGLCCERTDDEAAMALSPNVTEELSCARIDDEDFTALACDVAEETFARGQMTTN
jgi:hypothetical protein